MPGNTSVRHVTRAARCTDQVSRIAPQASLGSIRIRGTREVLRVLSTSGSSNRPSKKMHQRETCAGCPRSGRHRSLPHPDPPDQHSGHQYLGQPGAQHRPGPVCRWLGHQAAEAVLARTNRRRNPGWYLLQVHRRESRHRLATNWQAKSPDRIQVYAPPNQRTSYAPIAG